MLAAPSSSSTLSLRDGRHCLQVRCLEQELLQQACISKSTGEQELAVHSAGRVMLGLHRRQQCACQCCWGHDDACLAAAGCAGRSICSQWWHCASYTPTFLVRCCRLDHMLFGLLCFDNKRLMAPTASLCDQPLVGISICCARQGPARHQESTPVLLIG